MPEVENSIFIAAPLERVWTIARDVEAFPRFMPDVVSIRVLERDEEGRRTVVEWVGSIPEFKTTVKWVEEDCWDDLERTCAFRLVRGDFREYHGIWRFAPEASPDGGSIGTRFDSRVTYEYDIPLIGPLIKGVIQKKMRENVERLQQAIKERAERAP